MMLTHQICALLKDGKPRNAREIADALGRVDVEPVTRALRNVRVAGLAVVLPPGGIYTVTAAACVEPDGFEKAQKRARDAATKRRQREQKKARLAVKEANEKIRSEAQRERVERDRVRYQTQTQIRDAVAGKVANSVFAWGGANA